MSRLVLFGLVTATIMAVSVVFYWVDRNPDWEAYRRIFESGGAWLSVSGRDPVFLLFVELYQTQNILPPNYESFRLAIAAVFVYFSFKFMSGKVIEFPSSHAFFVLLPFLSLFLLRGSIQIREGISVVLLILALKAVSLPRSPRIYSEIARGLLVGVFIILSSGTHTAGLIGSAILILTLSTSKIIRTVSTTIHLIFIPLLIPTIFLSAAQFGLVETGIQLAESISGDRSVIESGVSFTEAAFWGAMIILNFINWSSTFAPPFNRSRQSALLQVFSRTLAGPTAISAGVAVLILKSLLVSPVVTVILVRIAELGSALAALLITVLYGRRYTPIVIAGLLLLKTYVQLSVVGF